MMGQQRAVQMNDQIYMYQHRVHKDNCKRKKASCKLKNDVSFTSIKWAHSRVTKAYKKETDISTLQQQLPMEREGDWGREHRGHKLSVRLSFIQRKYEAIMTKS